MNNFQGRGGGNSGGGNFGPRTMHKAVCANCGNACEVPFEPKAGRDVFCRDCYRNRQQ
ncbi:MAG: DNA-directed RNA polymerase [Nanoarchaeota archaeon]|nr:DNA-directed RNA polymerase [Nanoarchaeota archaeon]